MRNYGQPCGYPHCTVCVKLSSIKPLEVKMTEIKRKRHNELVAYNQKHDPLAKMPPEIMSTIFRFAIDCGGNEIDGANGLYAESAKTYSRSIWLASVCTRWRRIAFADPHLWSFVHIFNRTEYPTLTGLVKSWAPSIELVQEWLSRSGTLPLFIVLNWDWVPESEDETLRRIIEVLCAQCHRWRSLWVRVPTEAMGHFQSAVSERIINLDWLYINHDHEDYCADRNSFTTGHTTLQPRHVDLFRPLQVTGTILWTHVVSLKISFIGPGELLKILRHASQVEDLTLSCLYAGADGGVPVLAAPVVTPRLRKMWIGFVINDDLEDFFLNILAPELGTLHLSRYGNSETRITLDFLEPLLLHSGKKLHDFSTKRLMFSAEDLVNLLSGLDHLSRLEITFEDNNNDLVPSLNPFFNRLSQTSTEHPVTFLPRLSHFIYMGPHIFSWSAMTDVIEAQCATPENQSERQLQLLSLWPDNLTTEDYIDEQSLIRLLALRPSEMKMIVRLDEGLIQTSLEHHGINDVPFLFRLPLPPI